MFMAMNTTAGQTTARTQLMLGNQRGDTYRVYRRTGVAGEGLAPSPRYAGARVGGEGQPAERRRVRLESEAVPSAHRSSPALSPEYRDEGEWALAVETDPAKLSGRMLPQTDPTPIVELFRGNY